LIAAASAWWARWIPIALAVADDIRHPRSRIDSLLEGAMRYVCDAPGNKVWFQIETEAEAAAESALMGHAVEKYFRQARDEAAKSYRPLSRVSFEQNIALGDHIRKTMPRFLTLRDAEGSGLATAMLPPTGRDHEGTRIIVVGPRNEDPYPDHAPAIEALGAHLGLVLDRARCYPYQRG
jgi:hypothetical protein